MPHQQSGRTMQTRTTSRPVEAVLAEAKAFFGPRNAIYTAFLEREGPGHLVFRGQGGEELVIGAREDRGVTRVTGSSYLFDAQVARFLSSLPEAPEPPAPEPAADAAPAAGAA